MPVVSKSEAARLAGIGRNKLYDMIKSGQLSVCPDGIEVSELLRVFGEIKLPAAAQDEPKKEAGPSDQSALVDELRARIRLLEDQLAKSETRFDRCFEELQAAQVRLLPPPQKGFWGWLRGS